MKRCEAMRLISARNHAQVSRPLGDLDARDLLGGHDEGFRMAVGAQRADALGQHDVLIDRALGGQVFDAAMHVPGIDVYAADGLAIDIDAEIHRLFERDVKRADRDCLVLELLLVMMLLLLRPEPCPKAPWCWRR